MAYKDPDRAAQERLGPTKGNGQYFDRLWTSSN